MELWINMPCLLLLRPFPCNLQCNFALERCEIGKCTFSLQFANAFQRSGTITLMISPMIG